MDTLTLYKQYTEKAELPKGLLDYLQDNSFDKQAASTKYHGSYEGGLLEHSVNVTTALLDLTKRMDLKWEKPRSPYLVGLMHDLWRANNEIQSRRHGKVCEGLYVRNRRSYTFQFYMDSKRNWGVAVHS